MGIMSPKVLIIVGIIYLLNPMDIPGPVDDLIVNLITCSLAYYLTKKNKVVDTTSSRNVTVREYEKENDGAEVDKCTNHGTRKSSGF